MCPYRYAPSLFNLIMFKTLTLLFPLMHMTNCVQTAKLFNSKTLKPNETKKYVLGHVKITTDSFRPRAAIQSSICLGLCTVCLFYLSSDETAYTLNVTGQYVYCRLLFWLRNVV